MRSISLEIHFDDDSRETAEVYVDGLVNNVPRRFLFDTGCARTTLKHDDFSLQFPSTGEEESGGVFGRARYDIINVGSLIVGPIQQNRAVVSRAKQGELDRNLLGMDMLRDYCLRFAFDESRVELLDTALSASHPLMNTTNDIPCIDVQAKDTRVGAIWDTGASITLVDADFVKDHPNMFKLIGSDIGTDSSGRQSETPMYLMKPVTIGGHQFDAHKVVSLSLTKLRDAASIPVVFILGYSTLRQARWVLDFPAKRWGIERMQ
ncbi:MAG: retroviral-like aspartic protease family protein [Phycisphaeraceae bacterium]|nr:retroviral-like aspartic protease family protein [Phycisphaerales bacterium]MCB9859353.1 retroviral-like aspartic protease family protein [Phycisphaeraceae bacterium]